MRNLTHLSARGLLNQGLIELTPTLIDRYNACLVSMGHEPTELTHLYIDGSGWSPEVARERGNPYYLHNGLANPTAIIVTPEQYKKPVYFPVYSWVRGALRVLFETNHRSIYDVNTTNGIAIDFDNGLTSFESPLDLLLLTSITANSNTGGLAEAGDAQNALIDDFLEGQQCLDEEVRDRVRQSCAEFGDMRKRKLEMKPTVFDTFSDFYTVAFDGAAVLRHVDGQDLLILENQKVFESLRGEDHGGAHVSYLYDPDRHPFRLLEEAGMYIFPIEEFRKNPALLEEKRQLLRGLTLCDCEPDLDWDTCSQSKRTTLMKKYEAKVPRTYFELERFIAALKRDARTPEISEDLWYFLAQPADLPPATQEVLWILLTRKEPRRVLESYDYDKNKFIATFGEWNDAKQKWVANYIAERYVPRGKRS